MSSLPQEVLVYSSTPEHPLKPRGSYSSSLDLLKLPQYPHFLKTPTMKIVGGGYFERRSPYIAQYVLKLAAIVLPQPPRNYSHHAQLKKSCFKQQVVHPHPGSWMAPVTEVIPRLSGSSASFVEDGKIEPFPVSHSLSSLISTERLLQ